MKRFHVHVCVDDLDANVRFYSTVFGAPPSVVKPDYAKWMLDDPLINFAISNRGNKSGIDHLGIQVDSDDEFRELRERVTAAETVAVDQSGAACCYARSDKYWTTDPQGVAWETFHTLESIPVYGNALRSDPAPSCGGAPRPASESLKSNACCV
jgi:catechol 2,3-dioxygenase-like lactoylglutathione lyase family enzyme